MSPFSAHPHSDPATDELFNFGVSFSARRPQLQLYRFAPGAEALEMVYRRRFELDRPRSVHDFSLSPTYAVFYLSPYLLDMERLVAPGSTLMDALTWTPEVGTELLLVERESGTEAARLHLGRSYCLHLIGCHESDGDASGLPGRRLLHMDVIEMDEPVYDQYLIPDGLFPEVRYAQPVRITVSLPRGEGGPPAEVVARQVHAYREMCDFPAVDPRLQGRDYGDFWVLGISNSEKPGRKFFDRVVHLSWENPEVEDAWQAPSKHYLGGEPVVLEDPSTPPGAGCRGTILCQCFDAEAERSSFLLFDAFDVARGPVAEMPLRHPIPPLFHAAYRSDGLQA